MSDGDDKGTSTGSGGGSGSDGTNSELRAALRRERERAQDAEKQLGILRTKNASSSTESQQLMDRLDAMDKRAKEAELRAERLQIAQEKGLTPGQARRLSGTTPEELRADADELIRDFGITKSDAKDDKKDGKEGDGKTDATTTDQGKTEGGKPADQKDEKKTVANRYTERPKEALQSGASNGADNSSSDDPEKLADEVLRISRGL